MVQTQVTRRSPGVAKMAKKWPLCQFVYYVARHFLIACSVWGIHSKRRSFNSHIATSSDRQVPFGGLRHFCKLHRRKTLSRLFSKAANSLHWQPYKSLPGSHDTRAIGKGVTSPP